MYLYGTSGNCVKLGQTLTLQSERTCSQLRGRDCPGGLWQAEDRGHWVCSLAQDLQTGIKWSPMQRRSSDTPRPSWVFAVCSVMNSVTLPCTSGSWSGLSTLYSTLQGNTAQSTLLCSFFYPHEISIHKSGRSNSTLSQLSFKDR